MRCTHDHRLLWTLLFSASFFLPVHVLWYQYSPAWYPIRSYINGLPFSCLLLIPAFFSSRFARIWLCFYYIVFLIPTICSGMHLWFYQTTISPHSFFAIFGTSLDEAKEFIFSQMTPLALAYCVLLVVFPLLPLRCLLRMRLDFGRREKYCIGALAVTALAIAIMFGPYRFVRDNQAWNMFNSVVAYRHISRSLSAYMERARTLTMPGVVDEWGNASRTLVVAIGESSNRHHWSLYGYFRPTTPRLDALRSEMIVFNDAISAYANTMLSVSAAMSCARQDGTEVPVMNIFKQAGFETVWISNQSTIDSFNSIVQKVSGADRCVYLNRGGDQGYFHAYDERLLPALKEAMQELSPSGKRIVFLHMMGSHVNYASRVPDAFRIFVSTHDIDLRPWRNTKSIKYINDYDNSIIYTDKVLTDIIEFLKTVPNTAFLYFSDHGEEVFDTLPQHGHVHELRSRHYLDIPFFIWLSPGYRDLAGLERVSRWEAASDRPFMNDIAAFIMAELGGIGLPDDARTARNPLSDSYQPAPRMPYGINYEERYAGERGLSEPAF